MNSSPPPLFSLPYFFSLISLSLLNLKKSSHASLTIVIISTKANGATYVNKKPTLRMGKNWVMAITRKKRLKKNLN